MHASKASNNTLKHKKIRKDVFRNQAILDLASRGTIDDKPSIC